MKERLYLSPPHLSGAERGYLDDALDSNWIAPLGPHVDAFEAEFAAYTGSRHAAALSSGTAAIHLALLVLGVRPGDEVLVSTLTFAASVNPILYAGARPVFVDSEHESWNLSAERVVEAIETRAREGRVPKAVVVVHLYGQPAHMAPILDVCTRFGVSVIEDAAEALGGSWEGRALGSLGTIGTFSFNGNKVITTSGGGMLVSDDGALVEHARKLATQARDPAPHYQHSEVGYNYRLSNVLAAIGRGQLEVLDQRVEARRRNFRYYERALGDVPGITFMPEAPWGRHSRWLTTLTIDDAAFGADSDEVRRALEARNIEARPVWKPLHLQPVYAGLERLGGEVAEKLFDRGLCLPSGSQMSEEDLERVVRAVLESGAHG